MVVVVVMYLRFQDTFNGQHNFDFGNTIFHTTRSISCFSLQKMVIVLHSMSVSAAPVGLGLAVLYMTAKQQINVQTMANVLDPTSVTVLMVIRALIAMFRSTAVLLENVAKTDFAFLTRNWKALAGKQNIVQTKNIFLICFSIACLFILSQR